MAEAQATNSLPLKRCNYCRSVDATFKVKYKRTALPMPERLVRDYVCDDCIAIACARANEVAYVRPLYMNGPGGTRVMPNGQLLSAPKNADRVWENAVAAFPAAGQASADPAGLDQDKDTLKRFLEFVRAGVQK